MVHLSRLAEELIIWSSEEFGFIRLADEFTTGSSMMPQKRNPDFAELARGKTGRVFGNLMATLSILKGLPLSYNRDLQEDKEGLLDTVDTLHGTLDVMSGMIATMCVHKETLHHAATDPSMLATDLADYLVSCGMPFREAHGVMTRLCRYADEQGKSFGELSLEEYRRFSTLFDKGVYKVTAETSIGARNMLGGTAPQRVSAALKEARHRLETET